MICLLCTSKAGLEIESAVNEGTSSEGTLAEMEVRKPIYQKVTSFFKDFLKRLLSMFSKDPGVLETKGSFMIR